MSNDYRNNTVAGVFAAFMSVVVGHPFGTITVRMQSSSTKYTSALDCLKTTVKSDGPLALYRGFLPELLSRSATSAVRFNIQAAVNMQLLAEFRKQKDTPVFEFKDFPLRTRALSETLGGAACGVVMATILTPAELIKCRRQVLPQQSNFSILTEVWKAGGIRALYTGHTSTVARATVGQSVLFGTYEVWKSLLSDMFDEANASRPSSHVSVASGILSGCCVALSNFPFDAAKSRQQVFFDVSGRVKRSLLSTLKELKQERALYRGVGVVILRSIPLHGMYLPCYDFALQFLEEERPRSRRE